MTIDNVTSSFYVAPSTVISGTQRSQTGAASDPDGDGDGGVKKTRGHGHGQMQAALMQALQSLGLSTPQPATSSSASTSQGSTDSDGDQDGSTSSTSSVKNDMRALMHALFQAVKADSNASGSTGSTASTTDPKANFAAGLSALITQVSNGQAPADLQNAFSKVVADLQSTASTSSSTASTSTTQAATLQALLTQLQQNLGYGASSSSAAIGNLLSTHG